MGNAGFISSNVVRVTSLEVVAVVVVVVVVVVVKKHQKRNRAEMTFRGARVGFDLPLPRSAELL